MQSAMCEYILKNKDKDLLAFTASLDNFSQYVCKEVERYVSDELLPPSFISISEWLERRNYAKHKAHLLRWLREWQIDTVKGFIDITHALGLNDTLWVCPAETTLTWSDVSLYSNEFNDVVAKTAFSKGLNGLKLSSTSPEFTSEGSFVKCWVRNNNGSISLYKKGSEGFANSGFEPYSEFYASQLSAMLCRSSVHYDLRMFKDSLVSSCDMFTNESEGFVPVYKYLDASKTYSMQQVFNFMDSLGYAEEFSDMIVLDAVILNIDRHLGNFGFIVDNDTFRIKRFAPVFDHNMSLLARAMDNSLDSDAEYYSSLGHKIGSDFLTTARALTTPRTKTLLRSLSEFTFSPHERYNLSQKRLSFLEALVRHQASSILKH